LPASIFPALKVGYGLSLEVEDEVAFDDTWSPNELGEDVKAGLLQLHEIGFKMARNLQVC
jgi:hypothetical protein